MKHRESNHAESSKHGCPQPCRVVHQKGCLVRIGVVAIRLIQLGVFGVMSGY